MELKKLEYDLTICKVDSLADVDLTADFFGSSVVSVGEIPA